MCESFIGEHYPGFRSRDGGAEEAEAVKGCVIKLAMLWVRVDHPMGPLEDPMKCVSQPSTPGKEGFRPHPAVGHCGPMSG